MSGCSVSLSRPKQPTGTWGSDDSEERPLHRSPVAGGGRRRRLLPLAAVEHPAAVRHVSAEPLLGPLDALDLTGIDLVIAGGESGPGRRPPRPDWLRGLRDRCLAAGVAFTFKGWGGAAQPLKVNATP